MSHMDTLAVRLQESNAKDAERVEADEGACFFPLSDLLRKSPSPLVETLGERVTLPGGSAIPVQHAARRKTLMSQS